MNMETTFNLHVFIQRYPKTMNFALVVFSLLFFGFILEIGFRIVIGALRPATAASLAQFSQFASRDDTLTRFEPHPYLDYAPAEIQYESGGVCIGERFFSQEKHLGKIRVACLGASTTMNQFPEHLSTLLNRLPGGARFEVMDFGCDAWTSMETTINYMIRVSAFKPDFVIVHEGCNDVPPQLWPDYKPDYSHFRIPWMKFCIPGSVKWLISRSHLGCFLLQRLGLFYYDITNLTVRRIPPTLLAETPAPGSQEPFRRNLRALASLVQANAGRLIVAPMAYCLSKGGVIRGAAIEEFNAVSRSVARELGLRVAETDSLLKNHPDWFIDQVHLSPLGNNLKAQVFAMTICDMLGKYDAPETASRFADSSASIPEERDLEISWDYDPVNVREYHIFVRKDQERDFHYMGRTFPGEKKTFHWKAGAPQLVPILKEEFHEGPRLGHEYFFRVNPISKDKPSKMLGHLQGDPIIKVFERPWTP